MRRARVLRTSDGIERRVMKSILEPPDEHFDTPDCNSLQSREAASAATGAPQGAMPRAPQPRPDPPIEMTARSAELQRAPHRRHRDYGLHCSDTSIANAE